MNPLEAALLVALLVLPFHWLVQRELDKLLDPTYLRSRGVVIVKAEILEERSEPIGSYMGCDISGSVTFMGMLYRFERIVRPAYRHHIGARELFTWTRACSTSPTEEVRTCSRIIGGCCPFTS